MYGHVYCITNKTNGKKYIGQTTQERPARRGQAHFWNSANGVLRHAVIKYGMNAFTFEVIGVAANQDSLDLLEETAVALLNTISPNGYNLRYGGNGGGRLSDKVRAKFLKQRNTFEYRLASSNLQKIVQARPEVKIRQRLGTLAAHARPGSVEKRSVAIKAALARPETKQRLCEVRQKILATPGFIEKLRQGVRASKELRSAKFKNLRWITDGVNNRRIHKDLYLPDGWYFGRCGLVNAKAGKHVKDTRWVNNGKTNRRVPSEFTLLNGWVYGKIPGAGTRVQF